MAFRIVFSRWINPTEFTLPSWLRPWLIPQFEVLEKVVVPKEPETRKYEEREQQFKDAILRYSVRRIEEGLRSESFLIKPPKGVQEIRIQIDDFLFIEKLLEEKTCTYQVKETRDFFCSAASTGDKTVIGHFGLRSIAPTSRPLCRACTLPNTDSLAGTP